MAPFLSVMAALCAFALSCYGWGAGLYVVAYRDRAALPAYAITLGLVVIAFIGGILNAIGAASWLAVSACAYCGIFLAALFLAAGVRNLEIRCLILPSRLPAWLFGISVIVLGAFLAATLFPTSAFNFHDDFLSYLPRPIRMLATGTLGGNPFELLGLSDFGVQSFFHALMAIWLPDVTYAYAFDTVFCFLLGMWLLVETGRASKCSWLPITLAIIVYVLINPQIVNLSSVYSSTVLVLGLLIGFELIYAKVQPQTSLPRLIAYSVASGGTIATLIAIKLTSLFFVLPACAIFFGALSVRRRNGLLLTMLSGATVIIFLAPWLITHADKLN